MKKSSFLCAWIVLTLLSMTATACAALNSTATIIPPTSTPAPAPLSKTFDDPFLYCAAVGTVDAPDARYTGPKIPDEIINGYKIAAGLEASTEPMEMFKQTTVWRCMDSRVYACNFGANLPCSSKANTEKTPTQPMADYCKANPDSDFIPMSVTGHDTIYSWHCVKNAPALLEQIDQVDAAGFLARIWVPIERNPASKPETSLPPTTAPVAAPTTLPSPTPTPFGGSGQILFASNREGPYADLYLLDLASSQVTRLTKGESNTFPGPFSPDGSQLLFTGFGLLHSYVGVMAADGSRQVELTHAEVDEGFPAWSPDGKHIAFTSRRDGNNEIYVMNADGSQPKRLTNTPGDDFAPAWSPDGSQIAFVSDRGRTAGVYSIYLMKTDGSKVTRLTHAKSSDYTPAWSPDGLQLAFRSDLNGASDIYAIHADGSGLVELTNDPAEDWSPAWSPDGKLIAFQTNRDGNWELYVMNADGASPRNLTNNPADNQMPYWR